MVKMAEKITGTQVKKKTEKRVVLIVGGSRSRQTLDWEKFRTLASSATWQVRLRGEFGYVASSAAAWLFVSDRFLGDLAFSR